MFNTPSPSLETTGVLAYLFYVGLHHRIWVHGDISFFIICVWRETTLHFTELNLHTSKMSGMHSTLVQQKICKTTNLPKAALFKKVKWRSFFLSPWRERERGTREGSDSSIPCRRIFHPPKEEGWREKKGCGLSDCRIPLWFTLHFWHSKSRA